MSTLTTRSRQNEQELDALLEIDPSAATKSDTYVNNVEKLALNASFNHYLAGKTWHEGLKTGIKTDIEKEEYKETVLDSLMDENDYLSQLNEDKKLENLYLDNKDILENSNELENEYQLEPRDDPNKLGTSYDTGPETHRRTFDPFHEPRTFDLDLRSYAERQIESELEKGAVEADLDRVEKLGDEIYKE